MKKNKISKNWINKQRRDIYVRQSKVEGYRSRSAFKLIEMDKKFKFFKKNLTLLDLGSSPGGWSQVAVKKIENGKILAVDIKPMNKISNVEFINGDFCKTEIVKKIMAYFNNKVDVVLSDMAVNTTGNKDLDSIYTGELCMEAMNFSKGILKDDGKFVSKIFMGSMFNEIVVEAKKIFKESKVFKPAASRKYSKESFIICKLLQ